MASRHDGDWTMQVVRATGHRDESALHELVTAVLGGVAAHGGGRVDWWVYAPDESAAAVATSAGLRADRRLLQMRRRLPTEQRPEVVDSGVPAGPRRAGVAGGQQPRLRRSPRTARLDAAHAAPTDAPTMVRRRRPASPRARRPPRRLLLDQTPPPTHHRPIVRTPAADDLPNPSTDPGKTAEGSASDEADAARGQSEAEAEPAMSTGSASDEADAARAQSEAEGEPAMSNGTRERRGGRGASPKQQRGRARQ